MNTLITTLALSVITALPQAMDFTQENRDILVAQNPLFSEVFGYIEKNDIASMEPGRYDISGDDAYLLILDVEQRNMDEAELEVHNEYTDMQIAISRGFLSGVKDRNRCTDYKGPMKNDIMFYRDSFNDVVYVDKGKFIVFTPDIAHAPDIGEPGPLRKAVVKVRNVLDPVTERLYEICDSLVHVPPVIMDNPPDMYMSKNLDYGMTIGIERTPGGRIWCCKCCGGDNADSFFVLNWSDNGGKKWTDTKFVIDPHDSSFPLKRRTIVGNLWTDPQGRLWLFFDLGMTYYGSYSTNWCSVCENPDDKEPVWSEPVLIGPGCTLNKPNVASTGEWILPVSIWPRSRADILLEEGWEANPLRNAHHELDDRRGAHCYVSSDNGLSWEDRGTVNFPSPSFDEHIIMEKKDGTWWMTARTGKGIWQSFSNDRGYTWSVPEKYLDHVNSRHFIMRMPNGSLIMVRHGMPDKKLKKRSHLRAFYSSDDGRTWDGNLLLDERTGISYPDGFCTDDGYIYVSYDYERAEKGEIYMAGFTPSDILSKEIQSKKGFLERLIFKPGKPKVHTTDNNMR